MELRKSVAGESVMSASVIEELSEVDMLSEVRMQRQVVAVWARFLGVSSYERISDALAFGGMGSVDLAGHTRQSCS